jgi:hypothetical protein
MPRVWSFVRPVRAASLHPSAEPAAQERLSASPAYTTYGPGGAEDGGSSIGIGGGSVGGVSGASSGSRSRGSSSSGGVWFGSVGVCMTIAACDFVAGC